jgi:hypothetical protein
MNVTPLFLAMLAIGVVAYGNDSPKINGPDLQQQYQGLVANAEVIEGYRMVKVYEVDRLWRAVADSLKYEKAALAEGKVTHAALQGKIKALESALADKAAANDKLIYDGVHITFLGRDFEKSTFITMASVITVILLAGIVALLVMGKGNYNACREARKLYDDLYAEFDQYRHAAVERQIKLSRELQDYRNRIMEVRSA